MAVRKANAVWEGTLKQGKGMMSLGSKLFEGRYSFSSRFEEGTGTNPEELMGAALAGCFSMAFSLLLERAGYPPQRIETQVGITLEKEGEGFRIKSADLETKAQVAGIDEGKLHELAEEAGNGCTVSKALAGIEKRVRARLMR